MKTKKESFFVFINRKNTTCNSPNSYEIVLEVYCTSVKKAVILRDPAKVCAKNYCDKQTGMCIISTNKEKNRKILKVKR